MNPDKASVSKGSLYHLPFIGAASMADQCLKQDVEEMSGRGGDYNKTIYRFPSRAAHPPAASLLHHLTTSFVMSEAIGAPFQQIYHQPNMFTSAPDGNCVSSPDLGPGMQAPFEQLPKSLPSFKHPALNFHDSASVASLPVARASQKDDKPTMNKSVPSKKRLKRKRSEEGSVSTTKIYRPYQESQWNIQFQELLKFKARHGHCRIAFQEGYNSLSRWVKRQRYQYKLKQENKPSSLSDERIKLLEDIGFIWDSHAAIWEERLAELEEYKQLHGDCNVPSHYPENQPLSAWVKCQRRQYKRFIDGNSSTMTVDRFAALDRIQFTWKIRGIKDMGDCSSLDLV